MIQCFAAKLIAMIRETFTQKLWSVLGMTEEFRWVATNATQAAGRYDDVYFLDQKTGWAVSNGVGVSGTTDGGLTWVETGALPVYPRCIAMADRNIGWVGGLGGANGFNLLHTRDGWNTFAEVENLPAGTPPGICGLQVLDKDYIFAAGTNFPNKPTGFLTSSDGGQSWHPKPMNDHAAILVDIFFKSPEEGWIVGAQTTRPYPRRADVYPVVLKTEDGGKTWKDVLDPDINPPLGEWGWKIQFIDDKFGVIALENFEAGAILITEDGGNSWKRREIRSGDGKSVNENLEGIGFLDRNTGWVGGWGDKEVFSGKTSITKDGGTTWTDVTETWPDPPPDPSFRCLPQANRGQFINRFRFIDGVGYAAGNTIYKYTDEPWLEATEIAAGEEPIVNRAEPLLYTDRLRIPVAASAGENAPRVEIYDRFGGKVRTVTEMRQTGPNSLEFDWDLRDDSGVTQPGGQFVARVTQGDRQETRLVFRQRRASQSVVPDLPHMLLDAE